MAEQLRIAFLVAEEGIEQVELTDPWQQVEKAGGVPRLLAPKLGTVQGFNHLTPADTFEVDVAFADATSTDYDALVLPGGVANADVLRLDADAVRLVQEHVAAGKPVAAICHGPWLLVEADVVRGKMLTSFPSLATDIRNAGGSWEDLEVQVCVMNGWTLVTSRTPDDLEAFNREALKAFGLG
ncbi:type 1 glutamine amidotransferase domain-containing protein [Umezawaea sp. Da 62-37]|uniref:type 1 glutamine amidotransferase domain-containing protein n=1 Tax=Umezawaea sp. Da 62-37 TaxID=3075927 RepID=UPI0028F6CAA9|nr:type 1 glutamine amidotransferase domain-containing protein [Umezawaea sp. Da 62-37]WNV91088.1 type 1 glutamine amidotransferase domain-containing protein [Umezawaea sp. Da 62-37]